MKRTVMVMFVLLALTAGCKQRQAQWSQGQAGQQPVAPPVQARSADELRQLEAIAKENPNNKDAWITLGNARMDSQQYAAAIIAYQRALELDPKNVDVRVDMGTCYRGVGQPDKALAEYRKALNLNPRHANAYRNMGVVLSYDLHRNAEAIKAYQKYLEVYPGAPDATQIEAEIDRLKAGK
jgi:tetratricopeptide (TPR) repeat protein